MGGLSGFFKSVKKKITLKGVLGAASALPVVGGVISAAESVLGAAKNAATQAATNVASGAKDAQATQDQRTAGNAPASDLLKNPLVWIGAGLAALFLLRRK